MRGTRRFRASTIILGISAVLAVVALVLLLGAARERTVVAAKFDRLASETHAALCAFKSDLARRTRNGQRILSRHDGDVIRIYGLRIPRSQLRSSVQNQQRTLRSLRHLDCTEGRL